MCPYRGTTCINAFTAAELCSVALITGWNVPCIWICHQGPLNRFLYFQSANWKKIYTFLWPSRWVFNWLLCFFVCVLRMHVEGRMIWRLHTMLTTVCTASANGRRSLTWKETITRCITMSPFFSLGRILPVFSTAIFITLTFLRSYWILDFFPLL